MEARLNKTQGLRQFYHKAFSKLVQQGFVTKLKEGSRDGFFLTHFPVLKEGSTTTKVRIVMNRAAAHAGNTLNNHMLPGPKTINALVQAFLRFRSGPYALVVDVEAMFLNIQMPEADRKYHRLVGLQSPR